MNLGGTPGAAAWIGLAGISLVLALAIFYIGREERRIAGLNAVAGSYGLATLRYVAFGSAGLVGGGALVVGDLMLVASSVLLVVGALRIARVRVPARLLAATAAGGFLVVAWSASGGLDREASRTALSALGAVTHLIFAWALYRVANDSRFSGYRIPSALAATEALLRLFLPLLVMSKLQSIAVLLGGALYVATAIAFIIALQQTQLAEMKNAKRRALEAKRLAHIVFNDTADLMCIARVQPDGRFEIEYANRSLIRAIRAAYPERGFEARPGLYLEEVLSSALSLPAEDTDRLIGFFRAAARTGTPQTFAARLGNRHMEAVLTPVADGEGRVTQVFYRGTDVTDAVESRRAAAESSARFERLFNLSPVPLVVSRFSDGRYLEVNDAWVAFRQCPRKHALGMTSVELGVWADDADRARLVEGLKRDGRVLNGVTAFRKADGGIVDSIYSAEMIDWHGERAVLTAIQDVTELVKVRSEAQASSDRLARLFDSSPVPVLITRRADGKILEANGAFLQFMGAERADTVGRTTPEVGIWSDAISRDRLTTALRNSGTVRGLPVQMRLGASGLREVLLSAEAIDWRGEEAIVGFQIDVTEMRHAAEEIKSLNESLEGRVKERTAELEQALAEMEAFTYSVSHDLRAPLRAMTGFAELLAHCPAVAADSQAGAYAWRVSRAASRMGQMVDGLLRYAQLGRQPIKPRPVSLAAEVSMIAAALDEQSAGRRLHWEIGPLPEVHADPALLRLVLQNVIDNAVKYTRSREEARIEISAREAGGGVEITVRDNGIGFDMAYADKLFAPFERLHDAHEYDGTGIGLAHARRIVERHGGRMWCEAAPGAGAAFMLSLPH